MENTTDLDGKTKKATGRFKKPNRQDDGQRVAVTTESSSISRTEQPNRFAVGDSRWTDNCRSNRPTSSKVHLGKILERVEYLEREFVSYVRSHQTRLESRLEDSKNREQNFLQVAAELKEEILAALSDEPASDSQKSLEPEENS